MEVLELVVPHVDRSNALETGDGRREGFEALSGTDDRDGLRGGEEEAKDRCHTWQACVLLNIPPGAQHRVLVAKEDIGAEKIRCHDAAKAGLKVSSSAHILRPGRQVSQRYGVRLSDEPIFVENRPHIQ